MYLVIYLNMNFGVFATTLHTHIHSLYTVFDARLFNVLLGLKIDKSAGRVHVQYVYERLNWNGAGHHRLG